MRVLILVLGFVLGLVGTLGSFFFIDTLNDDVEDLNNQRNAATQEIDHLGRLALDYFIANQQGDLIFALALQESTNPEILSLIFQGNMLDRAQPVRNVIGALATAGLLDYTATYGEYEALNDVARESGAFDDYVAVKAFEQAIVEQAQARVAELQLSLEPLQSDLSAAESRLRNRQQFMILLTSAGAFLLLLANLVEHRRSSAAATGGEPAKPEREGA
jgi:hypothetical protein